MFKYNPWRAPGMAPVSDPCGMAGGVEVEEFNAAAYNPTMYAKQGDLGSVVLKPRPTGVLWRRGQNATVRWQQTADHGGGYQCGFPLLSPWCLQISSVPFWLCWLWLLFNPSFPVCVLLRSPRRRGSAVGYLALVLCLRPFWGC